MEAVTGSIFGICLSAGGRRKSAGTVRRSRRRSAKRGQGAGASNGHRRTSGGHAGSPS